MAACTRGQSTVEFMLASLFLLAFVFLFFQTALLLAAGNYVHYATFMAARAYMASGPSEEDQRRRAEDTMIDMVKKGAGQAGADRWPAIVRGVGGGDTAGIEVGPGPEFAAIRGNKTSQEFTRLSWQEGVRYRFRSKLIMVPFGNVPSTRPLQLTSTSWLGRETTEAECRTYLSTIDALVVDNGC